MARRGIRTSHGLSPLERLQLLAKTGGDGCWEWGAPVKHNYGRFRINGRVTLAHRFAYETFKGPIPDGLFLDHLCMNKHCCNPDHLEIVTQAENTRRYFALKTHCVNGHPFSGDNLRMRGNKRYCRMCGRENSRRSNWRRRGIPMQVQP